MPGRKASEEARRTQILRAAAAVAARGGLARLTIRRVAAKAKLSTGLVFFHFRTRDDLIDALLDHVLESAMTLRITPAIAAIESPLVRSLALLTDEMSRVSRDPGQVRLFFDFWAYGLTHRRVRTKIQAELNRYRAAFRPMAEEVLDAEPERFARVTADGLAAVVVSCIKGCAVQSTIDPQHFRIDEFLNAVRALVGELAAAA